MLTCTACYRLLQACSLRTDHCRQAIKPIGQTVAASDTSEYELSHMSYCCLSFVQGQVSGLQRERAKLAILQDAVIVGSTLSFAGSSIFHRMAKHFDVVIIDEAAQAVEPSVMVPLVMGCKQVCVSRGCSPSILLWVVRAPGLSTGCWPPRLQTWKPIPVSSITHSGMCCL